MIFLDTNGRLMLSQMEQGPNSHFPHYQTIDLTKHIEDCVRRVLAEQQTVVTDPGHRMSYTRVPTSHGS